MTEQAKTALNRHGITVEAVFVPWSKSRNYHPDAQVTDRTLNWKVSIFKAGRKVLETDYQAGIGHCPSYTHSMYRRITLNDEARLIFETEEGREVRQLYPGGSILSGGAVILPNTLDVMHALLMDSEVLDRNCFEDWADEFGYDPDSRSAEKTYQDCLAMALQLRNGLGEGALAELREAFQDY